MALTTKSEIKGTQEIISLSGNIDEDAVLSELKPSATVSELQIDFGEVQAINSCGVREWIKWLSQVPATLKISYAHCPKVIVDQINLVSGFLPTKALVDSFYVPYFCESCNSQTQVLFSKGKEYGNPKLAMPTVNCASCKKPSEPDVIEAKYFRFLG